MRRANEQERKRTCEFCRTVFFVKPCKLGRFCSRRCHSESMRTLPKPTPRPCCLCGKVFSPSRKRGNARYCSKPCIWKGCKGDVFNAEVSRLSRHKRRDALLNTGECKTYRKFYGKHEHRVIAENMLVRQLLKGEIVHHVDGDKRNNAPSNLAVMTQSEHARLHGFRRGK